MTEIWGYARLIIIYSLAIAVLFGYATERWDIFGAAWIILAVWVLFRMTVDADDRSQAWEARYERMTDTQKIDHHLDQARRYGSNVDANIAQALIERNRRSR